MVFSLPIQRAFLLLLLLLGSCSKGSDGPHDGTGGAAVTSGGSPGTGGSVTGPDGSGGAPSGAGGGASGGDASGGEPSGSGGVTASGGASSGGAASSGGGSSATGGMTGTFPPPDCDAPADLGVRFVGRHDGCTGGGVRMQWSGSGFVAHFSGTGLRMTQGGSSVIYTVVVDGAVHSELQTTQGEQSHDVVTGLSPGEHMVQVLRQGEASFGVTTLTSLEVIDGMLLAPPTRPKRSIEIFGDSITAGYGNEGTSTDCPFSAETENHYLTYGAILARHFSAELSTVAWSGKGVVVNYGGEMSTTLPQMMDRAIPDSATSVWDYARVAPPQLVIVNLGTNDFSTDNDPSLVEFTATYAQFLETIRARYSQAHILCTVGPLLSGADLSAARQGIDDAVSQRVEAGDSAVSSFELASENPNPGCDWHPNLATHQAMADALKPAVSQALGW